MQEGSQRGVEEGRRRKLEKGTKTHLNLTVTTASLVVLEMMMDITDEGVGDVVLIWQGLFVSQI